MKTARGSRKFWQTATFFKVQIQEKRRPFSDNTSSEGAILHRDRETRSPANVLDLDSLKGHFRGILSQDVDQFHFPRMKRCQLADNFVSAHFHDILMNLVIGLDPRLSSIFKKCSTINDTHKSRFNEEGGFYRFWKILS